MCISPVRIPNPNYHNKTPLIQQTTDTESKYINVPCGVCSECLKSRQMALVQRCRVMSIDHYIFFCTLTYNPESLPVLKLENGTDIPYADIKDVQRMMKRIRKDNLFSRRFKYFFVSERGKKGRPHFHGLIFIPRTPLDDTYFPAVTENLINRVLFKEWRRNYGSNRNPDWKPLFTFHSKYSHGKIYKNFDVHYVVPHSSKHGFDDVAFYVSKYLLKGSDRDIRLQQALRLNLDPDTYEEVWKIVRSRSFSSLGFGASTDYERSFVESCIERSADDSSGLKYYASDGTTQPLARYYRKFLDDKHAIRSAAARGFYVDDRSFDEVQRVIDNGERIKKSVNDLDITPLLPI